MKSRQEALEAERAEQPAEDKTAGLPPAALQHYEQHIADLQGVLGEGLTKANEEAAEGIRNLVARVAIRPNDDRFSIELQGCLALPI
jgi:site-specific DNA recombinase